MPGFSMKSSGPEEKPNPLQAPEAVTKSATPPRIANPAFVGRMLASGEVGRQYVKQIAEWACDDSQYDGPLFDSGDVLDAYLEDVTRFRGHVQYIRLGLQSAGVLSADSPRSLVEKAVTAAMTGWRAVAPGVLKEAIDEQMDELLESLPLNR
jgi:hypothetical protein